MEHLSLYRRLSLPNVPFSKQTVLFSTHFHSGLSCTKYGMKIKIAMGICISDINRTMIFWNLPKPPTSGSTASISKGVAAMFPSTNCFPPSSLSSILSLLWSFISNSVRLVTLEAHKKGSVAMWPCFVLFQNIVRSSNSGLEFEVTDPWRLTSVRSMAALEKILCVQNNKSIVCVWRTRDCFELNVENKSSCLKSVCTSVFWKILCVQLPFSAAWGLTKGISIAKLAKINVKPLRVQAWMNPTKTIWTRLCLITLIAATIDN